MFSLFLCIWCLSFWKKDSLLFSIIHAVNNIKNWNLTLKTLFDLEVVLLSEVSQTEKDKYNMILLIRGI